MRLTEKISEDSYLPKNEQVGYYTMVNKLGQLEDIEQEFQIDNFDDLRDRLKIYKFLANHEMSCVDVDGYNCMLKDLKEYHDIEKELGIDLITLFKALKDGIWFKSKYINAFTNNCIKRKQPYIQLNNFNNFIIVDNRREYAFKIKDYGKTWALTEEELL